MSLEELQMELENMSNTNQALRSTLCETLESNLKLKANTFLLEKIKASLESKLASYSNENSPGN